LILFFEYRHWVVAVDGSSILVRAIFWLDVACPELLIEVPEVSLDVGYSIKINILHFLIF